MKSSINNYNSCKRIALKAIGERDSTSEVAFNSPTIIIVLKLESLGLIPKLTRNTAHFSKKALYAFGDGKEPIESKKQKKRRKARIKNNAKPANIKPNRKKTTAHKKQPADFLLSWEWTTLRYKVLQKHGRRCMCCGATPDDRVTVICVDHIKPRHTHPHLSLDENNLQVLCHDCNKGKGAWDETDYRHKVEEYEFQRILAMQAKENQ